MCFVLIKGSFKDAKRNKTLKLKFVKKRARQFVLFLKIGAVKQRTAFKETAS